jgi:hypothetical protein
VSPKTECKFIDYLGIKKSGGDFRKRFSLKYIYMENLPGLVLTIEDN